jgi:hypothetical protein
MALSRRAFAGHLAALLSSLSIARRAIAGPRPRRAAATEAPLDHTALLALGAAVLPSELGTSGVKRTIGDFERWLGGYKPGAELLHGYGTAKLDRLPPSPAARWSAQLRDLDGDARKRHDKRLTDCTIAQRRALVHDRLRSEKLGPMPAPLDAGHVAIGLMAHFYSTPEADDLCYGVAIGKSTCRPLADQAREPVPLRRPV